MPQVLNMLGKDNKRIVRIKQEMVRQVAKTY